jgi:hypothetical protein
MENIWTLAETAGRPDYIEKFLLQFNSPIDLKPHSPIAFNPL